MALLIRIPMLLDNMSNKVDRLYAALPDRLYLLDEKGVVIFRTVIGSPGYNVDAWHAAVKRHVGLGRPGMRPFVSSGRPIPR